MTDRSFKFFGYHIYKQNSTLMQMKCLFKYTKPRLNLSGDLNTVQWSEVMAV